MARQIFRQEAIDLMASPDRLDRPLNLVRPADWMLLAAGGAIILFALVWGLVTSVPVEVKARGILISANGLSEISTQYQGRVEQVLVKPGQIVATGQVIARLSRSSREREIQAAKAALRDAAQQASLAETVYRQGEARMSGAERSMIASLDARRAELQRQLASRDETVENLKRLHEQNAATREEIAGVVAGRDEIRAAIRQLEQDRRKIDVDAARRHNERGKSRLVETQQVSEKRRELAQLKAQTAEETLIRAAQPGEIVEITANPGDVLAAGESLATLDTRSAGSSRGGGFEAVLYAAPADGKRVRPGMKVKVVPTTAEKEIYGHIPGKVVSATMFPASPAAMRRYLQNDRLVEELSASGAPIEIRVGLERNRSPSGFVWSSSQGPNWAITRGTIIEADIVIERRPFIEVLLPGLIRRLALPERTGGGG